MLELEKRPRTSEARELDLVDIDELFRVDLEAKKQPWSATILAASEQAATYPGTIFHLFVLMVHS